MALSGIIDMDIAEYWKLQIEWSAKQNYAANQSTIRADLYWMATRSDRGRLSDSSEEFVQLTIDGVSTPDDITANVILNDGQKKLILSSTVTVTHDTQGNRSVEIGADFDINTYLRGTYYSGISVSEEVDLNPIPRESAVSTGADWTVGVPKVMAIKPQSVAYSHKLRFLAKNTSNVFEEVYVLPIAAGNITGTSYFGQSDNEKMFRILNKRASTQSKVVLETWSGTTMISATETLGTMSAPQASYSVSPTTFIVGQPFVVALQLYNYDFRHTVRLKHGTTVLKEYTFVEDTVNFATADIVTQLNALMPVNTSVALKVEVVTFYGNQQVQTERTEDIIAQANSNAGPSFLGEPTYSDTNTAITAVTGNNQFIVQNKSTVRVILGSASRAIPNAGSTIKEYVATLGGKTVTKPWSETAAVIFDFGTINSTINQTLMIRAVDTRGRSASVTVLVKMLPYNVPGISGSAMRESGYMADTRVTLSGTVSSLKVNGVEKNSIVAARVRSKEAAGTVWTGWTNFSLAGFPTFTATDVMLILNNLSAFHLEIQVSDKLGTTTLARTVQSGKPLFEIDELLNAIGFGDFPTQPNTIMMGMRMMFGANKFGIDAGQGETGGGAIFMNNSDITGINGLWFNDFTTNTGEGLLFPKSTAPWGSTDVSDYNHLTVQNGVLMIDNKPIAMYGASDAFLWEGASFLGEAASGVHTVTPSRRLSNCPNGWILIWSEYNSGAVNAGWQFSFVPKRFGVLSSGGTWLPMAGVGGRPIVKYFYCSDTTLTGHARNDDAPQSDIVLRYVLAY